MPFLLSMSLPFLACLGLIAVTSALWWRSIQSPWAFAIIGFLALLGVHRAVQAGTEVGKVFIGGGYFLEARTNASLAQLARENITLESLAISFAVVVAGLPLLFWLKRVLPAF
jgi:hypothetical protein